MSLRKTTIIFFVLTTIGLVGVLLVSLNTILRPHFAQQQELSTYLNIQRVQKLIDQQQDALAVTGSNLATWPEVRDAVVGNLVPLSERVADISIEIPDIDFIALFDADGVQVYAIDLGTPVENFHDFSDSFSGNLRSEFLIRQNPGGNQAAFKGIIAFDDRPVLLAGAAVNPSGELTPNSAYLVVGQFLTDSLLQKINDTLFLTVTIYPLEQAGVLPETSYALYQLSQAQQPYHVELSAANVSGYVLWRDLYDQPVFLIRVDQFPTIYNNGELVSNYMVLAVIMSGVTFSIVLFLLVEYNVLARLRKTSAQVVAIGKTGDIEQRLSETRNDELGRLGLAINDMLAELQSAQHLRQQSEKRLESELLRQVQELGALYESSQVLLSEVDIEAMRASICSAAVEKMGVDAAWLAVQSADESSLAPIASIGIQPEELIEVPLFIGADANDHLAVQAWQAGAIRIVNQIEDGRQVLAAASEFGSAAAIPLTQGRKVLAVLMLMKREKDYFTPEKQNLFMSYAALAGWVLQNALLFRQVVNGRERLQNLSRRLVEVQEEERRKIALELHDEIGQILTGLRFSVTMLASLPPDQVPEQADKINAIVTDLIARVRQMSLDLRPSMLDDLGIVPTLIWHFERYTDQTGIKINFQPNNLPGMRFRTDIETTVYRVIQEALTNIARHAGVKQASVRLWSTEKILGIQIEDEGVGFDPETALSGRNSRGLIGMRERIGFIGGQLLIISQPGQGSCLTIEIPLVGFLERRRSDR